FGVAHKEQLKKLRTSVDVLTMSATPIPRTLEMAFAGIREMSTVDTPPEDRQPVLTYVGPWDGDMALAAVRRELLRGGQVFWVHNRVETIERAAGRLREALPDARIATAHGEMDEERLEKVMLSFWDRSSDVLVCTTIIESGLDVPSANTLVVERADRLGLAQLYQLRGRVGRSAERAFAYFFFPPQSSMTDEAHERLAAISRHTALGRVRAEAEDRFGELPAEVRTLFAIGSLRISALAAGVDEVSRFRDQIRVRPVEEAHGLELAADRPDAAYHATTKTVNLTPPK